MDIVLELIFLIILDVILSIDNAILIATVTKKLEGKDRKIAQILGATFAILMRLIFVLLLLAILNFINIPIIYIIGGSLLVYLGISITKNNEKEIKQVSSKSNIMKAVLTIIISDLIMSFDNAFIIAEVVLNFDLESHNIENVFLVNTIVIAVALMISLIIIVFFANYLTKLMEKNFWIMYIASWLLISLGIEMILKDSFWNLLGGYSINDENLLFVDIFKDWGLFLISHVIGGIIILSKWYFIDKNNESKHKKMT